MKPTHAPDTARPIAWLMTADVALIREALRLATLHAAAPRDAHLFETLAVALEQYDRIGVARGDTAEGR